MIKIKFFFLISIFTLLIFQSSQFSSSTISYTYNTGNKRNDESFQKIIEIQEISEFVYGTIADKLISLGEQANSSIKWKNILNKTDDGELIFDYYPGQRGMSSIGNAFIQIYESTQNLTYLSIINKIGNYIKEISVSTDNGTSWPKSESNPWNWTGIRYGNAGIIPVLISLNQMNNDSSYYDLVSKAADYLVNVQKSNVSDYAWWLTVGDTGFITTDYYYGTAGIVSSLLDAYLLTKNDLYLNTAIKGANWLDSLIEFTDDNHSIGFIPWAVTNDDYFNSMKYTGIVSGQAGIGKVFLKLYNMTNNEKWFTNAKTLGNWLKDQNINDTGLFPYPGSPYLTNRGEEAKNLLGVSVGSMGIADFFLDLFEYENYNKWLYEVIRITNRISESLESTEYGYLLPFEILDYRDKEYFTGYFYGLSGAFQYLSRLVQLFNIPDHLNLLEQILSSLQNLTVKFNGIIPTKLGDEYILTNGENGLASIILGLSFIDSIDSNSIGKFSDNFKNALLTLPEPELTFINKETTVNVQIFGIIMSIVVLSYIKRKLKSKKRRLSIIQEK